MERVGRGQPVHLMGNSLGGTVSTVVAATRPDLVRTLTLVSPALPVLRPRLSNVHLPALAVPWAGQQLAQRLGRYPVEQRVRATIALCWADPSRVPPERFEDAMTEADRRARLEHDGDAMIKSLRSLMTAYLRPDRWPLWRLAARVQAPTLLVYGLKDRLVDPRTAVAGRPHLPGQPAAAAARQRARVPDGTSRCRCGCHPSSGGNTEFTYAVTLVTGRASRGPV